MPKCLSEPDPGVGSRIKVLILTPQKPKPWGTSSHPAVMQRVVSGTACPGCAVQLLQGCSLQKPKTQTSPSSEAGRGGSISN